MEITGQPSAPYTESTFLGTFAVHEPCRVGFMSGESGAATIQDTAFRVAASKGLRLEEAQVFWEESLPHLSKKTDLRALADAITDCGMRVCIIDPAYLCLLNGGSVNPSDVFGMGRLLGRLSRLGKATECTIVLIHHFGKARGRARGNDLPGLEDLAMAGFAEWARQWILLNPWHYDSQNGSHQLGMRTGGSAGHSGEFTVNIVQGQREHGRRWEVALEPISGHRPSGRPGKAVKVVKDDERVLQFLKAHPHPEGLTMSVIRSGSKITASKACTAAVQLLLQRGVVEPCKVQKANQEYDGFRLVSPG